MKITTAIVLDTRRPFNKKNGNGLTYPVKLRVTQQGKQKYYSAEKFSHKQTDFLLSVFALTKEDFEKAMGEKPRAIHKDRSLRLNEIEQQARKIIDDLPTFTFEAFEKHFATAGRDVGSVYSAYENCIQQLEKEGRIGTAIAYRCSYQSLKKHSGNRVLKFSDINVKFLQEYQRKMTVKGNSLTTVGIYLRCLRSLFNDAMSSGIISREFYPFGKRKDKKYPILKTKGTKKALLLSEIEQLYLYRPSDLLDSERRSLDLWLFSYLCNGINIHDIARMKFENITSGKITFIRKKTEHTGGDEPKQIRVSITPRMNEIIERWGNQDQLPGNYVFGILSPGLEPKEEKKKVALAVKTINQHMKVIAANLKITKHVTTYTSRHSWATVLKRKGYSTAVISEGLGHTSEATTQAYLDSFEDDTPIDISNSITNFEKDERHKSPKIPELSPEPLRAVK